MYNFVQWRAYVQSRERSVAVVYLVEDEHELFVGVGRDGGLDGEGAGAHWVARVQYLNARCKKESDFETYVRRK